ncbi:MAG: MFS transporter, partial [Alphaproteobacteria bacterium]|nr:MFS transporter [Alphaproteobacteria bacterium]
VCYLVEVAPPRRRALYGSFVECGLIGGILAGSAVATLFHMTLSHEALAQWGWRLPFLGGLILGILGWALRRGLLETPVFQEILDRGETAARPVIQAIRQLPLRIAFLAGMLIVFCVALNILFLWMPVYLTHIVHPPVAHALLINTFALMVIIMVIVPAGALTDRIGHKPVLAIAMIAMAAVAYPLLVWMDTGALAAVIVGQTVFAVLMGLIVGATPVAMASPFPPEMRYSGMAIGLNVSVAIFSGTAPFIATWLIKETGNLASPAWYVAAAAVVSCAASLALRDVLTRNGK